MPGAAERGGPIGDAIGRRLICQEGSLGGLPRRGLRLTGEGRGRTFDWTFSTIMHTPGLFGSCLICNHIGLTTGLRPGHILWPGQAIYATPIRLRLSTSPLAGMRGNESRDMRHPRRHPGTRRILCRKISLVPSAQQS